MCLCGDRGAHPEHLALYEAFPKRNRAPSRCAACSSTWGQASDPLCLRGCHSIGLPLKTGRSANARNCHLRHEFSLEQARKAPRPATTAHIGPDHPQWEIYQESPHGIAYMTQGDRWNWEADAGTLTVNDFPAPTCAICHMSGFGPTGTTHDVGDRLTWYLFAPISERRPAWEDNRVRMQGVCRECHNANFLNEFYAAADEATEAVNEYVHESDRIMARSSSRIADRRALRRADRLHFFRALASWEGRPNSGCGCRARTTPVARRLRMLSDLAELRELAEQRLDGEYDRGRVQPAVTAARFCRPSP